MYVWDSVAQRLIHLNSKLINHKGAWRLHPAGGFPNFNINQVDDLQERRQPWLTVERQIFVVMKKKERTELFSRFWATLGAVSIELGDDVWVKWPRVTYREYIHHKYVYKLCININMSINMTDSNLHYVFVFILPSYCSRCYQHPENNTIGYYGKLCVTLLANPFR